LSVVFQIFVNVIILGYVLEVRKKQQVVVLSNETKARTPSIRYSSTKIQVSILCFSFNIFDILS